MAYWSRYGRRYRRYRKYRRFYRAFRRGYARKYVNSSSRSSVRMKTTVTNTITATAGHGADATGAVVFYNTTLNGTVESFSAANSPLYRTYCSLYEECKIIGMKVNMAVVSAVGGSDIPSLQIYTAWDRKHGYGEANYTAADIKAASTYAVSTALNNNVAKIARSCYASDLMEKATWFDATLDSNDHYINTAWKAAAQNPNFFMPTFYCFLNSPSLGATKSVSVSMSVTYYFAFRNPRYGGSASSAKIEDLGARSVSFPDGDDDGMDDDVFARMDAAPANPPAADEPPPDPDYVQRRNAQIAANRRAQSQARVVNARNRLVGQVGPVQKN